MTALSDIKCAIDRKRSERESCPLVGRHKLLVVEIGKPCAQAIRAETREPVPDFIDHVPVQITDEFPGWVVTER